MPEARGQRTLNASLAGGGGDVIDQSRSWIEVDLERLIRDEVQENVGLDYKAAAALGQQDALKREVAKDVSAFANSAGGVLVYGMAEDGHRPIRIEPINPNPLSKEWLENVILSNIQPRIADLHVNPVQLTGANARGVAYIVTVPQSHTAHQAPDHRYYKRFNFQSVPMEDFEVRDTMNRGKTPIIEVIMEARLAGEDRQNDIHHYELAITLDNRGAVAAKNMKLILDFPGPLQPEFGGMVGGPERVARGQSGREYRQLNISAVFRDRIIFPSDFATVGAHGGWLTFDVDRDRFSFIQREEPVIAWTVYADDMAPRTGEVPIAPLIRY